MKIKKPIAIILCMMGFYGLHAGQLPKNQGSPSRIQQFISHKNWDFVENKGQLSSSEIRYYGHQGGVYLYCQPGKVSFVFTKTEKETNDQISESLGRRESPFTKGTRGFGRDKDLTSKITTCRAGLTLLNSNLSAQILASDQQEYYENYYTTGNADSGITNVHTYKTITYRSIYPKIDLVLHACPTGSSGQAKPNGLKYEFIVHPGGKISDIQIQWNGFQNLRLAENGEILYSLTFIGGDKSQMYTMNEKKPESFQGPQAVSSSFHTQGNEVSFNVGGYDKKKDLIIDPVLNWGTYFGGSNPELSNAVATDKFENVYITGRTESTKGIATNGSYQTILTGSYDAFIAKFTNSGKILWATYYGGTGYEESYGMAVTGTGTIYITGYTNSSSGIATVGAYCSTYSGGPSTGDAYLAKFNTNGIIQWATYYGGEGDDAATAIRIDASENTYLIGYTNSTTGIATNGSFQTSLAGSNFDVFLAKFNKSGNIQWATYYGGNGVDMGEGMALDNIGNIYVTGSTESRGGIATNGVNRSFFNNNIDGDAFLAKFTNNGSRIWSTYYGGHGNNLSLSACTDIGGNIYIAGNTTSKTGIATAKAYDTVFAGYHNMFLTKLDSGGKIQWATYYLAGVNGGNDIITDQSGDVYYAASSDSFGIGDVILVKFSSAGSLLFSVNYGGGNDDASQGLAIDGSGNIYVAGWTGSDSEIATKGAYQTSYGGKDDAFLAQFVFKRYGYDAGIETTINTIPTCAIPTRILVNINLKNYGSQTLHSFTISWKRNGKLQSPFLWAGSLLTDSTATISLGTLSLSYGGDTIIAWTSSPNGRIDSVPQNDTGIVIYNVEKPIFTKVGASMMVCAGTIVQLGGPAQQGHSYSWTSNPPGFTSHISNPRDSAMVTRTYYLTETIANSTCGNTDTVRITVSPVPIARIKVDSVCFFTRSFSAMTPNYPGNSYAWQFGDGDSALGYAVSHTYAGNGKYSVFLKASGTSGCLAKDSIVVDVNEAFSLNIFPNPYSDKTGIYYTLVTPAHIEIAIIDVLGRYIATLVDRNLEPGEYITPVNAYLLNTRQAMYFVVFKMDNEVIIKKIIQYGAISY